ncbi:MAG: hypothetical protein Q9M39_00875 [Sulfurovum sp.]|nr:hypothetical protein [Sulfurovum sp.]
MQTYIDPFTDFGFKRIFGSEESKPLLISLKHHRDWVNTMTTAMDTAEAKGREEGREEGIEEGVNQEKIEIARNLLKAKVDLETIQLSTGLSKEVILSLAL